MKKPLISNELRAAIAPLLPPEPPKPKGGRPRCDDRAVLVGIIFVLRSGIPWEMPPRELGCSGMTCWLRVPDWQEAGVWARLHRVLLERLSEAGQLDWSRASLDSAAVAAKRGAPRLARTEPDGSRQSEPEAPCCGRPARRPSRGPPKPGQSSRQPLLASTSAVPGVRHGRGRPRRRPKKLHADKAYDHRRCRKECRAHSILPRIARRGVETSERLGRPLGRDDHRGRERRRLDARGRDHRRRSEPQRRGQAR
jgi:transposase